jgi:hypothetical protein
MSRISLGGLWVVGFVMLSSCHASVQAGAQVGAGVGGEEEDGPPAPGEATEERSITIESFSSIRCNHSRTRLAAGTYRGDLVVGGNHCTVEGAGADQTVIDGALILSGNHNVVRGVTVLKSSRISGNHNDASGAAFRADVATSGNHNTP